MSDRFRLCPLPQYVMQPPVTERVPLHKKSLSKNIGHAPGDANNMHPLTWGGWAKTEKSKKKTV